MLGNGVQADVLIRRSKSAASSRRLAEPNLVALSGDTASFLAGGEFPIPVPSNLGSVTVEFKKYGVGLAFTPTVLGDGLINLKIEPEVSQIDPTTSITIGGDHDPGADRAPRQHHGRAARRPELRDRRPAAEHQHNATSSNCPGSATCRCSARCSRSAAYQKNETDLAIIVTPRLVRPARPGDVLRTPLDSREPANDADFFLLGQAEITVPMDRRLKGRSRRPRAADRPHPRCAARESANVSK